MATEEAAPLANEVSQAFVEQYFHILGHSPHHALKFYADASVVSRPAPDGTMLSFTSVEAINKQILSCDYEGTTFDVLSVDSQHSFENGILVLVFGIFTGKDNLKKRFSQLFYLALQEKTYVVLNDILRFVDDEVSPLFTLPAVESVPKTETAKPAKAVEKSVNAAEVKKVVAEATLPLDNGKKKPSDEKVVTAQKPKELAAETASPQPLSFAAIVQSLAKNAAPFQVKAPVQKPKYTGQPRAAAAAAPATIRNSEKKNVQKIIDEPGTSIFVANLPLNAMPPQLFELFKEFGPIKEDGIQVRSKAQEFCFGFVAFESAASVQSVLQAAKNHPFMLAGRKLRVKEKEVDYDGNKRSGGKAGGGSKTQNDSADGGDEFKRIRNRKNGGRRGEKSNGGGAHDVKA